MPKLFLDNWHSTCLFIHRRFQTDTVQDKKDKEKMPLKRFAFITIGLIVFALEQNASANSEVSALVARKAAIISILHKKAEKALVNAAQDRAYKEFLHAHAQGHTHHDLRSRVDRISLQVQSNFQVEEMCLIAPDGAELSRIVGNQIAYDLSSDETGANFFQPGFAKRPRTVYVSPIYMSPDANKWVVAYVTPVSVEGDTKAILHYEHGLDIYQNALGKDLDAGERFVLTVDQAGWVIADSRKSIAVAKDSDQEDPAHYFERFRFAGLELEEVLQAIDAGKAIHDDDGAYYDSAYQHVGHWTLIAFQRR